MKDNKLTVGTTVRVGKAYVGSGKHRADGNEGVYFVFADMGAGDYKLSRDRWLDTWDVIVNESRLTKVVVR